MSYEYTQLIKIQNLPCSRLDSRMDVLEFTRFQELESSALGGMNIRVCAMGTGGG